MIERYVYRAGQWIDPRTGEPMPIPEREGPTVPRYVVSDIEPYRSPVDGSVVGGRSQKRYDLAKNNCVEAPPKKKFEGYRNPKFAQKRGLPLAESARS